MNLPPGFAVLPLSFKRESFLKLLRFCKEEVSRSDGGDSAIALFLNLPPLRSSLLGLRVTDLFCFNLLSRFAPAPLGLQEEQFLCFYLLLFVKRRGTAPRWKR